MHSHAQLYVPVKADALSHFAASCLSAVKGYALYEF